MALEGQQEGKSKGGGQRQSEGMGKGKGAGGAVLRSVASLCASLLLLLVERLTKGAKSKETRWGHLQRCP